MESEVFKVIKNMFIKDMNAEIKLTHQERIILTRTLQDLKAVEKETEQQR